MAIALFGGSFNPPHAAHQLVALYVLETQDVDALWLVPTFNHPFGKPLAAYEHRVAMCELAVAPLGARARVDRSEEALARRPDFVASRTLDLIEMYEALRPGERFRLVIGSDILGETSKWHRWDEVARRAPPIVLARPGHPGGDGPVMPDVSATRVRELLAARDPAVSALVPRTVLSYIDRHGLFRDGA
jgi:nicotinate-nucleotide adenylyltransferase